jgi:[glutamine synthetase] adenylyltransferase / [glutamine synthetase]-adenylyl-L-tyrosine phosphorylase
MTLENLLREAVADGPLADALATSAARFVELRAADPGVRRLSPDVARGLARALAASPRVAGFLSHRPGFLESLSRVTPRGLADCETQLAHELAALQSSDLEASLDTLRLRRREEVALASCLDLAGLAPFEAISRFLSALAESTAQCCLRLALETLTGADRSDGFCVIGLGKIAGREFTYHSDLDLIFLHGGGPEDVTRASRIGQRMIAYLTTMTGAGIAYAVDTRLRPSGQQGMLVTSVEGFERYQIEKAEMWEHLAMLRARPIAGDTEAAEQALARVRTHIFEQREVPWIYLKNLRDRVEMERAAGSATSIALKTGPGGLMDVEFLAGGGLLEVGTTVFPPLPSVSSMLTTCVRGARVDGLLDDYRLLRLLEARARWMAGRAVESISTSEPQLALLAELVEPGMSGAALTERLAAAREGIRRAYTEVVEAGTIRALAD